MRSITINGQTYNLPEQGDPQPWGEELSDIIDALADVSNNVSGTGDILTTSFTVANNTASATNITGLSFDPAVVRSAIINYSCYRSTASNEVSEAGTIYITYKSTAATWELARVGVGDSGMQFTITGAGQVQYTSTNLAGASYAGLLKFNAKAFTQS